MKKAITDYFISSKSERIGFAVLFFILFIIGISYKLLSYVSKPTEYDMTYAFDNANSIIYTNKNNQPKSSFPILDTTKKEVTYFEFDPNHLSAENWKKLGLSEKQINVIHNYEKKVGKFMKPEDLKKVYSISDKLYNRLEPYIKIKESKHKKPSKFQKPEIKEKSTFKKEIYTLDINSATENDFKKIKGIGNVLSKRIIKFRNKLGGFHSINQLYEVDGLDKKIINDNLEKFVLKKDYSKIDINNVSFKKLLSHLYFDFETTKAIINYRDKNYIEDISELQNVIPKEIYQKVLPYISIK